jgi:hypothetical protein
LFLRLARHGNFAYIDDVVVDYRLHDANLSGRPGFLATSNIIRVRTYDSPDNTPDQQRSCRRAWRVLQRRYARRCRQSAWTALAHGSAVEAARQIARTILARARQVAGRPTALLFDRRHVTPPPPATAMATAMATGHSPMPGATGRSGAGVADSERSPQLQPR